MLEKTKGKIGIIEQRLAECAVSFEKNKSSEWQQFGSNDMLEPLNRFLEEDCEGNIDEFLDTITELVNGYMLDLHTIVEDLFMRREDVVDKKSLEKTADEIPDQYWQNVRKIPFSLLSKTDNFFSVFKITLSNVINILASVCRLFKKHDATPEQRERIEKIDEALAFFAHDVLGENSLSSLRDKRFWYNDEHATMEEGVEMYHASLRRLFACCLLFIQRIKEGISFPIEDFDVLKILNDVFVLMKARAFNLNRRRDKPIFDFSMNTNCSEALISGSPEAFFLILYNITKNIYKLVINKYGTNLRADPSKVPLEVQLPDFPIKVVWNITREEDVIFLEYLDEGVGLAFTEILEGLRGMAVEAIREGVVAKLTGAVREMASGSYHARPLPLGYIADAIFAKSVSSVPSSSGSRGSGLGLYEARELLALSNAQILATPRLENRGVKILIAAPLGEGVDLQDAINRYMDRMDMEEVERISRREVA